MRSDNNDGENEYIKEIRKCLKMKEWNKKKNEKMNKIQTKEWIKSRTNQKTNEWTNKHLRGLKVSLLKCRKHTSRISIFLGPSLSAVAASALSTSSAKANAETIKNNNIHYVSVWMMAQSIPSAPISPPPPPSQSFCQAFFHFSFSTVRHLPRTSAWWWGIVYSVFRL